MTKNIVGVNGIDPARQGFTPKPIDRIRGEPIGVLVDRSNFGGILGKLGDSLANRANAIRPYDILRRRSNLFLD